jgi:antirestriction protein ArdC
MIHSTGHGSRLDRWKNAEDTPKKFGCDAYAKEELVAEIGACMMLASAGVEFDLPNSAAYLRSWVKALKDDKSLIFKASAKAQAAANHIQGVKVEEEVSA